MNPDSPQLEACSVPAPSMEMDPARKMIWRSLAAQVEELGTYSRAYQTAFELLVEAVHLAKNPKPGTLPREKLAAITSARGGLVTFGLDPASAGRVQRLPKKTEPDEVFDR